MDLTRDDILRLVDELIEELRSEGIAGTISIYGGSAIAFYHSSRGVTRDIDSMFEPSAQILMAAKRIAARHNGLQEDWLNNNIRTVMPKLPDENPKTYYQDESLIVEFGSQEYLLAMKAVVSRRTEQDLHDAALLYNALELSSWLDIARIVAKYHTSGSWGSQELFWEDIEALANELRT
jgi:hypothetical protein